MTHCSRHCYRVTGALCKNGFSADDKVLIKSLYQFSGRLVQTFNQNFIVSTKNHVYTTLL